jgi:Na+-transporting methylmalonyl-CoA/oxaloacetate decarboxylase gamma subunit
MENLGQAVLIMTLGMGGVYAFLTVQAFITVLLERFAPADEIPAAVATRGIGVATATPPGDSTHVAVIQAAIAAYESDKGVPRS